MNENEYTHARQHSRCHRAEIISSRVCGCFYCLRTFPPSKIRDWCDPGQWVDDEDPARPVYRLYDRPQTARCPYCGIDSVLGNLSGFPITTDFLRDMQSRSFDCSNGITLAEF